VAQKRTKAEKAATRRAKELAAKRHTKEPLKPIDIWAVAVVEAYEALVRAGWDKDHARWYVEDTMRIPDWIIPNPDMSPYEDEEEQD
jgi:hypothetical protein